MPYRTLGELRVEVLARIGMGSQGTSGGANQTLIDSFLRNGQMQLYRLQDWKHLEDYADFSTGVGQNVYDYPIAGVMDPTIGCARDKRVLRVETNVAGQFVQLTEGITTSMWSTMDSPGQPERYDRYKQILIYPQADTVNYIIRVWFIADLGEFTQSDDPATLDDEMILLHAITNAKLHYRQPDAQAYQGQLDALLGSLRGQSFGSNGVYRRSDRSAPERKPVVVGRT